MDFFSVVNTVVLHDSQFLFLFLPHSMQDLSSLTRNGTRAPCSRSTVLSAGLPGKSPQFKSMDIKAPVETVQTEQLRIGSDLDCAEGQGH